MPVRPTPTPSYLRVYVNKPKELRDPSAGRRENATTVYLRGQVVSELLAMSDDSIELLCTYVSDASETAYRLHAGETWSSAVIRATRQALADRMTMHVQQQAENNAAWEQQ